MSRADHDQHRRDIDGIHTDMALLDEDLNNRVDALESTVTKRFDDINDLGENTDHEVELLKARVSALESIPTQDDTIQVGDRVTILDGESGTVVDMDGDVTGEPYLVHPSRNAESWWFAADQLRPSDIPAQEAQGMAWVDLEEESTYRKIAEARADSPAQEAWTKEYWEAAYRDEHKYAVKGDELLHSAEARADAWSLVARGLARRCADLRGDAEYQQIMGEHVAKLWKDQADLLVIGLNGAEERAIQSEQERDEARETARDLAVQVEESRELLKMHEAEAIALHKRWRQISDEWRDRALKAESDVVNAELAQSRAASEKRIDPAGEPRPYNDGLRFNDA